MSVYNGEKYLSESIDSILNQSYENFEFIIINDNSHDSTKNIINERIKADKRIKVINNNTNIGLTKSLNKGIEIANGEFIARMDADDISFPERLAIQYQILENTKADICFCSSEFVNEISEKVWIWKESNWYFTLWRSLFSNNYGLHPTVMFRRDSILKLGGYNIEFLFAQDYDLWDRCSEHNLKFVYTQIPLFRYFFRDQGVSRQRLTEQEIYARKVSFRAIQRILPECDDDELYGLRWIFCLQEHMISEIQIQAGLCQCFKLVDAFLESYEDNLLRRLIWEDVTFSLVNRLYAIKTRLWFKTLLLIFQAIIRSRSFLTFLKAIKIIIQSKKG